MLKLFKYFKQTWWEVLIALAMVAGQAYCQLLLTDKMGEITQIVQSGQSDAINQIWIEGGLMIAISVGVLSLAICSGLLIGHATSIQAKNIRSDIYQKVSEFSLAEYDNLGKQLENLRNDGKMKKFLSKKRNNFICLTLFLQFSRLSL